MKFLCTHLAVSIPSFQKENVHIYHYERQGKRTRRARNSGLQEEVKFRSSSVGLSVVFVES